MGAPTKPLPDIGELNATADAKVRDIMQELQSILTGNVDRNNLKDGETTKAKLATDALQAFLQLLVPGTHKVKFGVYDDGASWGIAPERTLNIPHGMGGTPVWAIAWADTAVSTASATDPVAASLVSIDGTNIVVKLRTLQGGNCNFPGVNTYWLAIV